MSKPYIQIQSGSSCDVFWINVCDEHCNTLVEVNVMPSHEDGAPLVFVDIKDDSVPARLYLNEDLIHRNPPHPGGDS